MPLAAQAARGSATARAISPDQSASRPRRDSASAAVSHHEAAKDQLHHRGLEDQQQDKESEQLGEDFASHFRAC